MSDEETLPLPIGSRIRELRKAKGMTITALAQNIDRSVGYISQIERNLSEVSISALTSIANALEVQIGWFFESHQAPDPRERGLIVRGDNVRTLNFAGTGVHEDLLSPDLKGNTVLIRTTTEPGSGSGETPVQRDAEEAGTVLQGSIELQVNEQRFQLHEGDSFRIPANACHSYKTLGETASVVLWVITPPRY